MIERFKRWANAECGPEPDISRLDILPIAWGFTLTLGGADVFADGLTLESVIYFAVSLLGGFLAFALFGAASLFAKSQGKTKLRALLYELSYLAVLTFIATGAPWK